MLLLGVVLVMPDLRPPEVEEQGDLLDMLVQDRFNSMVERTLSHEGKYVNDPDDPGGETNFGISKRAHPGIDIKKLTREGAKKIYREEYYERPGFSKIADHDLASKVFDIGVNTGTVRSTRFLQQALNSLGSDLRVDGVLGPKTLAAVNEYKDQKALLKEYKKVAGEYYKSLKKKKYLKGWLRRLES